MNRAFLVVGLIGVAGLVAWWSFRRAATEPSGESHVATPRPPAVAPKQATKAEAPRSNEEPSHLADTLNSPTTDIRADLRVVSDILDAFRSNFPRDGNPVGDNVEITAALAGRNKLGLALIPPKHPAINKEGQLCDRWGTPFFFHAESAHRMEIRSAGPDRKMWTADDVVFAP